MAKKIKRTKSGTTPKGRTLYFAIDNHGQAAGPFASSDRAKDEAGQAVAAGLADHVDIVYVPARARARVAQ